MKSPLTKKFNISSKLREQDCVSVNSDGTIQRISIKCIEPVKSGDKIQPFSSSREPVKDNGKIQTILTLIKSNPIALWNAIHTRNSKISLVRPAYSKLTAAVYAIDPKLVEENNKKHDLHKTEKKLVKEVNAGKLDSPNSHFSKKPPQ